MPDRKGYFIWPVYGIYLVFAHVWLLHRKWISGLETLRLPRVDAAAEDSNLPVVVETRESEGRIAAENAESTPLAPQRVDIHRLPEVGREFVGRSTDLRKLTRWWNDESKRIVSIVAWGGSGKTSLIKRWLASLDREGFLGADRVFGWSFYGQGTAGGATTSDLFLDQALRFFGDPDPAFGNLQAKGTRLAMRAGASRNLIVLDGLERLQYPPGPGVGRLRDEGMRAFLRGSAAGGSAMCVLTTRMEVEDVAEYSPTSAAVVALDSLGPADGGRLLYRLGVRGSDEELRTASAEFGGHALSLTLVGTYLRDAYGGDVTRRSEIRLLREDAERDGHARRVLESYEQWLGAGPELELMKVLSLFERPVVRADLDVVWAAPAISGLTDRLCELPAEGKNRCVAKLGRASLILQDSHEPLAAIDVHPLVREYFTNRLRENGGEAWREGHLRLYEYLRDTTPYFPETVEGMEVLYRAYRHGCQAGRHEESYASLFLERIRRENEAYSWRYLGMWEADLAALSEMFLEPWTKTVEGLSPGLDGHLFHEVGFLLSGMGRLAESLPCLKAGTSIRGELLARLIDSNASVEERFPTMHGVFAGLLTISNILTLMGRFAEAQSFAQQAVKVSHDLMACDPPDHWRIRESESLAFSALARVKFWRGDFLGAIRDFVEAEFCGAVNRGIPIYVLGGSSGCDYLELIFSQGSDDLIPLRHYRLKADASASSDPLVAAYSKLGLARIAARDGEDSVLIKEIIDEAMERIRLGRSILNITDCLINCVEIAGKVGEWGEAESRLAEAEEYASRGGMQALLADCYLQRASLLGSRGELVAGRDWLMKAKKLADEIGFQRRQDLMRDLEVRLTTPKGA